MRLNVIIIITIIIIIIIIINNYMLPGYIHRTLCKRVGLHVADKWACYGHILERIIYICMNSTSMWDAPGITDRTVLENRPDRVLHDKKKEETYLAIEMAASDDTNVNRKETEKIYK
jgi:hypothetical protein